LQDLSLIKNCIHTDLSLKLGGKLTEIVKVRQKFQAGEGRGGHGRGKDKG
jgi:hypothetical protein